MSDSSDGREHKLSILGKVSGVFNGHLPLVYDPHNSPLVAEGTAYEETAASTQKYLTVGAYVGAMASRWCITVLQWCERTNRNWEGPWFQGGLILGVIPATLLGYFLLRLFDHPGRWETIFGEFSSQALFIATFVSFLLVCMRGATLSADLPP